jgi:Domain of Unknown Function with PDB structure (DUF3857)/Transglutaminase-like superfamily/Domain of Unknown Function with PDB structure (DUF3858)
MNKAPTRLSSLNDLFRNLFFLFCLVLLTFSNVGAQKTSGRRSADVTTTAAAKKSASLLAAGSSTGITFEKYSSSYYLNSDGTAVQTLEIQDKCTSKDCIDQIHKYIFPYNGDLQQVKTLEAYVIKANGQRTPVAADAIKDQVSPQGEAAPGFSSLRVLEISFGDLLPGDSVGEKIEVRTAKPVFGNNFSGFETFPVLFGWDTIDVDLSAPKDYPVFTEASGLQGGKLADANGRSHWHWSSRDVKSVPIEMAMTDVEGISPRLAITTFKEFAELGSFFGEAVRTQAAITPEIEAAANDITKGITDPAQQAATIYKWVNQNVRYLQTYVGRDGWVPHTAARILANRYGDCKDYTTLIYALLKVKGIESVPVLTRISGSDWFPTVAAMNYFNHAILYIPSLKAIADATVPNTRLGMVAQPLLGKKMLLAGSQPALLDIPKDRPADNRFDSEIDVTYGEDGTLRARSLNNYYGRAEMLSRSAFDSAAAADPEFIKIMLAIIGVNGSGHIVKTTDTGKDGQPYAIEFETEVPGYGGFSRKGKITIPVGVNLQNILAIQALLKADVRRSSLMIGAETYHEKYLLHIPPSVTIGALPSPVTIENAVGRFAINFKTSSNGIEVDRELVTYKDTVTPQEYPLLRELVQKSLDAEKNGVEYTSATANSNAKQQQLGGDAFSIDNLNKRLISGVDEKPLTRRQAVQLEQLLKTHPDDFEAHRRLAVYYDDLYIKDTPTRVSARLSHRLWFVEHHPEISDKLIFNHMMPLVKTDSDEYRTLRGAWLKQVAASKTSSVIRLNAAQFIGENDKELAMQLLADGATIDPADYQFPFQLAMRLDGELKDASKKAVQKKELGEKLLANGEKALLLIKTERSGDRDEDRFDLLKVLCKVSIDLGEPDKARAFAQELILDFGPSPSSTGRASATHVGNITLGQAALAEGNIEKAKEYLLIAIRAPLRLSRDDIESPDTKLAAALYAKGEKAVVVEYLKLCLERGAYKNYPSLYKSEIDSIKLWLSEIDAGKAPSFELEKAGA